MRRLQCLGVLGAAALLACALQSPASAQPAVQYPGACKQFYPNANCTNYGPGSPYTGSYQHYRNYWDSRANWAWYGRPWGSPGFWPGDVAAGVVGGAVATAGAIATAPFRAFAYDTDEDTVYGNDWSDSYPPRPLCVPGTWFRGPDGRPHLCR